jgi:hypothetical protein
MRMTYKSHGWWLVTYDSQSTEYFFMEELVKGGKGAGREESLVCNGTLTQISPQFHKTLNL